jgi:polysaccharide pyruvyl transferase WcaK-like protein
VRDSYTVSRLASIGVDNVVNTGCPTLWALTPEFRGQIPQEKSDTVVVTLTDYNRDPASDVFLLEAMTRCYERVWFWPQGFYDVEYLDELCDGPLRAKINMVPATLEAYDEFLENNQCDYVGTRLHGGIRALHHRRRALIISIDNRAREMGRDFCLKIVERGQLRDEVERLVRDKWRPDVRIDQRSIEEFKLQF